MKKIVIILGLMALAGCSTIQISSYIKGDYPYQRKMYGEFNKIVFAVRDVLAKNGWKVKSITNPAIYERVEDADENNNILIFTEVKEKSMFLSTKYAHLNVFIHAIAEGATVEIRFSEITPLLFKQMRSNRSDKAINNMLQQIEQKILESR